MPKPPRRRRVTEEEVIECVRQGHDTPEKARKALGLPNSNAVRQHFFRLTRRGVFIQRPDGGYDLVGEDDYADERDDGTEEVEALFQNTAPQRRGVRGGSRTEVEEDEKVRSGKARDARNRPEETQLTTGSEEAGGWPAERVYGLVAENFALGWSRAAGERPDAQLLNQGVEAFLCEHGLPPVFPRGFRVNMKNLPALLAKAYDEGLHCAMAYIKEAREEQSRCQRCQEVGQLQARIARLEAEAARWRNEAQSLQVTAEKYKSWWLAAREEAAQERAKLQKRIQSLEAELKTLRAAEQHRQEALVRLREVYTTAVVLQKDNSLLREEIAKLRRENVELQRRLREYEFQEGGNRLRAALESVHLLRSLGY